MFAEVAIPATDRACATRDEIREMAWKVPAAGRTDCITLDHGPNLNLWTQVKDGAITAFSVAGLACNISVEIRTQDGIARIITGLVMVMT